MPSDKGTYRHATDAQKQCFNTLCGIFDGRKSRGALYSPLDDGETIGRVIFQ